MHGLAYNNVIAKLIRPAKTAPNSNWPLSARVFAAPGTNVAGLVDAGDPPAPEAPALPIELLGELELELEPDPDPMPEYEPDPAEPEPVEPGLIAPIAPEGEAEPSVWLDLGVMF